MEDIKVSINVANTEEAIQRTEKLISLLKEAKSLADDLATVDMKLLSEINI